MPSVLRLILGDQLNHHHSWFKKVDDEVIYVMMEMRQETDYVAHHIQKVMAFFLAMRTFRDELTALGHKVHYLCLDDTHNTQDLKENILNLVTEHSISEFQYMSPDEYRVFQQLKNMKYNSSFSVSMVSSEHFLSNPADFANLFKNKKTYLMETLYREMRKKYQILMDVDGGPLYGKWNFDAENRKKIPDNIRPPAFTYFQHEVEHLQVLLEKMDVKTIGNPPENNILTWPVSRHESLQLLQEFVEKILPYFGDFQDAMTDKNWHLFHSRLSFSLNTKLLHPLEVVNAAEQYWRSNEDKIKYASIEGFIRQIIGWREYMRNIYWLEMPAYAQLNYFEHRRPLPQWYWTGKTKMYCLSHSITQSLEYAYAHHIQRLMVTGNFALLAGIHPDEVDRWYLGIYIDALQWVEITNTRGMSQFADGGIVGTKPYVSSANYIDKMSDYCKKCTYDPKIKTGDRACPFNSLYWHFFDRNREKLAKNPRIGMAYVTLQKMKDSDKKAIMEQAEFYLDKIEEL